jgi:hypothetical protein
MVCWPFSCVRSFCKQSSSGSGGNNTDIGVLNFHKISYLQYRCELCIPLEGGYVTV